MKHLQKFLPALFLVTLFLLLTGCSSNQQIIFDASAKLTDAQSYRQHSTVELQFNGSGFAPEEQATIDQIAAYLNGTTLEIDAQSQLTADGAAAKALLEFALDLQGMSVRLPIWVDYDFSGDEAKFVEIYQLPGIADAFLPPDFQGNKYAVVNIADMPAADLALLPDLGKLIPGILADTKALQASFAQRFNPNLDVTHTGSATITTPDGAKEAQLYQISLDDAQCKQFLRDFINSFLQDPEVLRFINHLTATVVAGQGVTADPNLSGQTTEDGSISNDPSAPLLLELFNEALDQFDTIPIIGDQGVQITLAIADGYCLQSEYALHFHFDPNSLIGTNLPEEGYLPTATPEDFPGTLDLQIKIKNTLSAINALPDITLPELTADNSFNYFDLLTALTPPPPAPYNRLAGANRYETARIIAEDNFYACQNIVVIPGTDYASALTANILAMTLDAPILLADPTPEGLQDLDSFLENFSPNAAIYLVGGTEAWAASLTDTLSHTFYPPHDVQWINGEDPYATAVRVAQAAELPAGGTVLLAANEIDAAAAAAFAGLCHSPLLLTSPAGLSAAARDYLAQQAPSYIFLIGGAAALPDSIAAEIRTLLPSVEIIRLAGNDRYETQTAIARKSYDKPPFITLASGVNLTDALISSASMYAQRGVTLFVDPGNDTLPPAISAYLAELGAAGHTPHIVVLGGPGAVPDTLVQQALDCLNP
ncbi:MAG: cell wall-binding repeat-containing protein [Peptococcaceae bacterium]|jgi:putative cell wall-binding protein|nr:cell wall-binding repeat-containing protein [Peptococcaceae bacterium]